MLRLIRNIFFENFLLKVISFFIALFIWFFVDSKLAETVKYAIPLKVYEPQDYIITQQTDENGNQIESVLAELTGLKNVIRTLHGSNLLCEIKLTSITGIGDVFSQSVSLSESNFNLPPEIRVTTTPRYVNLQLVKKLKKEVSLLKDDEPFINKSSEFNYHLVILPDKINVEGPLDILKNVSSIKVKPVDVSGRTSSFTTNLEFDLPLKCYKVSDYNVMGYITVEQKNLEECSVTIKIKPIPSNIDGRDTYVEPHIAVLSFHVSRDVIKAVKNNPEDFFELVAEPENIKEIRNAKNPLSVKLKLVIKSFLEKFSFESITPDEVKFFVK